MGRQEQPERDEETNINERYIVEDADITGVSEEELTQALRDDLHRARREAPRFRRRR